MAAINGNKAVSKGGITQTKASLMINFYKQQDVSFVSIMQQMTAGKEVLMPDGKSYDMEEDIFAFTLAANRWLEQQKTAENYLLEIYKQEGKWFDQIAASMGT